MNAHFRRSSESSHTPDAPAATPNLQCFPTHLPGTTSYWQWSAAVFEAIPSLTYHTLSSGHSISFRAMKASTHDCAGYFNVIVSFSIPHCPPPQQVRTLPLPFSLDRCISTSLTPFDIHVYRPFSSTHLCRYALQFQPALAYLTAVALLYTESRGNSRYDAGSIVKLRSSARSLLDSTLADSCWLGL